MKRLMVFAALVFASDLAAFGAQEYRVPFGEAFEVKARADGLSGV